MKIKCIQTKKVVRHKSLHGGDLYGNIDLNKIESLGFEIECHYLMITLVERIPFPMRKENVSPSKRERNELALKGSMKGSIHEINNTKNSNTNKTIIKCNDAFLGNGTIISLSKNIKLTADEEVEFLKKIKFGDRYVYKNTILDVTEITNGEQSGNFDCEFHALYKNLRANNKNINILRLFYITLLSINKWLNAQQYEIYKLEGNTNNESNAKNENDNIKELKVYSHLQNNNYIIIDIHNNSPVIAPQLTIGVKLENIKDVIYAYLSNSGVLALTNLMRSISVLFEKINSIIEKRIDDTLEKYFNNDNSQFEKWFSYTRKQFEGITFLLTIEIINRQTLVLHSKPFTFPTKNSPIRLRYSINNLLTFFNNNALFIYTDKDIYTGFNATGITHDNSNKNIRVEKHTLWEYIEYILTAYVNVGNTVSKYDGKIMLLELRTFQEQLIKKVKHHLPKHDKKTKTADYIGNISIEQYIEALPKLL
jgi:hypothetical protein